MINDLIVSENDISLILGSPTGEEFSVTSNFNGESNYVNPSSYKLHDV